MTDETDDEMIGALPATPAADPLALLHSMLTMVTSARQCERRVKELRRETAAAEKAKGDLAAGHAEIAAERAALAQERSELATERADIEKRRLAVHVAEGSLAVREKRQAALEKLWHDIGEPAEVLSGFKDPERPALHKALRAHGILDEDAPARRARTGAASRSRPTQRLPTRQHRHPEPRRHAAPCDAQRRFSDG
jgi:hypothetical protein